MRIDQSWSIKERGSVLVHVLVTSILIALIAAAILRMSLLRSQMGSRSVAILQEKRDDQAALASVLSVWNAANKVCGGAPTGWTGCSNPQPTPGQCGCTCNRPASAGVNAVTITTALVGGSCQLSIQSTDI